jgi:ribosomal RNA-processing protein 9
MPDSFFAASKPRKRKRLATSDVSKPPRKGVSSGKTKQNLTGPRRDEELESDQTDEDDDLRRDEDAYISDEEDENETPAQKRLRLAQLYIDSVKNDMRLGRSH